MTRRTLLRLLGLSLFAPTKPLPLPEPIKPVPPLPVMMRDRPGGMCMTVMLDRAFAAERQRQGDC